MSERGAVLLLQDIKVAVTSILQYTQGLDFETYETDLKTRHAVERNFEIIGEAASRIPSEFKNLHPLVEWRIIKDFRNFIIHDYFGINNQIVWDTIQFRLPELLLDITALIKKEKNYFQYSANTSQSYPAYILNPTVNNTFPAFPLMFAAEKGAYCNLYGKFTSFVMVYT